jgi:hypothetical protein
MILGDYYPETHYTYLHMQHHGCGETPVRYEPSDHREWSFGTFTSCLRDLAHGASHSGEHLTS